MDYIEMRNSFSTQFNNIMSNQAPGLNGYEISLFLTKGQDETLKNYFNPKGNKYQEGADDSPKRQIDFSNLMVTTVLTESTPAGYVRRDPRSQVYLMPVNALPYEPNTYEKPMFILNEYALLGDDDDMAHYITVRAISYQEYQRLMSKPYKWPVYNEAWRLLQTGGNNNVEVAEVISRIPIPANSYYMTYIRKPKPIIVENLTGSGVSLEGYVTESSCELDSILHEEVVQRAVELAKAAYIGDLNATIQMGQRSE